MTGNAINCIVPDVVDTVPANKVKVNYCGLEVNDGNELTPTQVKEQPLVDWPVEKGALYTLVMTDPDAPSRENPVRGQIKHWLVINIPENRVSEGRTLAAYRGSGPSEGSGLHRYIFLVYKQSDVIITDEPTVGNRSRVGRQLFKVRDYAKQHNLGEPVAANFYQAQYDDWVPIARAQVDE